MNQNEHVLAGKVFPDKDEILAIPSTSKKWGPSKYPIYSYFYNTQPNTFIYESTEIIPFDRIMERMQAACEPLIFEYYDESEDIDFATISPDFFEKLFFLNHLYLGYFEDCEDEDREGEFQIYTKIAQDKDGVQLENHFLNLITNEMEIIENWKTNLVEFWWNGRKENFRFNQWFNFCWLHEFNLNKIYEMKLTCTRKIKVSVTGGNVITEADLLQIKKDMDNTKGYVLFVASDDKTISYEPFELAHVEQYHLLVQTIWNEFDRGCAELGRVANLTAKESRVSGLENWKDIHSVACRQRAVLTSLNRGFRLVNKKWGKKIKIKVVDTHLSDPESEAVGAENPQVSALEYQNATVGD